MPSLSGYGLNYFSWLWFSQIGSIYHTKKAFNPCPLLKKTGFLKVSIMLFNLRSSRSPRGKTTSRCHHRRHHLHLPDHWDPPDRCHPAPCCDPCPQAQVERTQGWNEILRNNIIIILGNYYIVKSYRYCYFLVKSFFRSRTGWIMSWQTIQFYTFFSSNIV